MPGSSRATIKSALLAHRIGLSVSRKEGCKKDDLLLHLCVCVCLRMHITFIYLVWRLNVLVQYYPTNQHCVCFILYLILPSTTVLITI